MKILHIGNLKSGIDTYVRNVISYANDDFDFIIVRGADDNSAPYIRNEKIVKQYTIDMYRALNPICDLRAIIQAINIIRKEQPDLVHCHSAKGGVIGRIAAFLNGIKSVYTPHAFSYLSAESKWKQRLYLALERTFRLNSVLLGCSESERQLGIEVVGYPEKKALAWKNAIPWVKLEDIEEPKGGGANERFIVSVGRPSYQKNPHLMVEIMKRIHQKCPAVKLYIIGVGFYSPMLEDIKELITFYGLEKSIILLPWQSHAETMGYINKSVTMFAVGNANEPIGNGP